MNKKMFSMVSILAMFALILSAPTAAFAHCGKCGMDGAHKEEAGKKGHHMSWDEKLAKKQEMADTFDAASVALKESNPELSEKLAGYAADKKEQIEKKKEWIAQHKEEMKDHAEEVAEA